MIQSIFKEPNKNSTTTTKVGRKSVRWTKSNVHIFQRKLNRCVVPTLQPVHDENGTLSSYEIWYPIGMAYNEQAHHVIDTGAMGWSHIYIPTLKRAMSRSRVKCFDKAQSEAIVLRNEEDHEAVHAYMAKLRNLSVSEERTRLEFYQRFRPTKHQELCRAVEDEMETIQDDQQIHLNSNIAEAQVNKKLNRLSTYDRKLSYIPTTKREDHKKMDYSSYHDVSFRENLYRTVTQVINPLKRKVDEYTGTNGNQGGNQDNNPNSAIANTNKINDVEDVKEPKSKKQKQNDTIDTNNLKETHSV